MEMVRSLQKIHPVKRFHQTDTPLTQPISENRVDTIGDAVVKLYEFAQNRELRKVSQELFGEIAGGLLHDIPNPEMKSPIIDTTDMYYSINSKSRSWEVDLRELDITPSFKSAIYAYGHSSNKVVDLLSLAVIDRDDPNIVGFEDFLPDSDVTEGADLSEVRWIITASQMIYGVSDNGKRGIYPVAVIGIGINNDGRYSFGWFMDNPDLSSQHGFLDALDMTLTVTLMSQNIANCANVEYGIPHYNRAAYKRMARKGVAVGKLMITDQRKSYKGTGSAVPKGEAIPLTDVRGHVAHYGACCDWHEPRGKLFGKYDRKVYVPPHARGSAEFGVKRNDYEVHLTD